MGVKDLWTILAPVKREKGLEDLAGKRLAVDLSGWVCQADTTKALAGAVHKPYLRNLFFRILRLYSEGVSLVMVVDGEATQLKWSTMDQREKASRGRGGACNYHRSRQTGRRTQLDLKINECLEVLDALGVPYLHSQGEAEAFCGLLNQKGLVDGVLTQDSDTFLYGATVVYRDLSTNERESHVDCYSLEDIRSQLGLNRKDMISLALLLGCDYCPQGVPGVGKEGAMKLIAACKSCDRSCDMLDVMRRWRDGTGSKDMSKIEMQVKRKALAVPGFPSEAIISEYLISKNKLPRNGQEVLSWRFPQVLSAQVICHRRLEWPFEYTHTKVLSLMTQWCLRKEGVAKGVESHGHVIPQRVSHLRKRRGIPYYEVEWKADGRVAMLLTEETMSLAACPSLANDESVHFTTLEKATQFICAYPALCAEFEEQKKQPKKKTSTKGKRAAKGSPHSSDELSTALSQLELNSQKQHKTKMKAIKTEPATVLCCDAWEHTVRSLSQIETKPLKNSAESIDHKEVSRAKPRNDSECIDLDEVLPLAERLNCHKPPAPLDQQKTKLTHTECIEIPSLAERLKAKSKGQSIQSNFPHTTPYSSSQHDKADVDFKKIREMNKDPMNDHIGQFWTSERKQIVISDSSSESETEDPMILCGDAKVGGAHKVMSSLHHQYCDSSEEGSSSDDCIPPLVNRIGSKRQGASSSPLKSKLSPTKDLVLQSKTQVTQVTTNMKKKLGFESRLKDDIGDRNCDIREIATNKGSSCGEVGLSGTCCIGSAESPIEID